MRIANPVRARLRSYATQGHRGAVSSWGLPHCDSEISLTTTAAPRSEDFEAETGLVELKPRWRPSEHEIVLTAITVTFVSLMAIIAVAAAAILTMG